MFGNREQSGYTYPKSVGLKGFNLKKIVPLLFHIVPVLFIFNGGHEPFGFVPFTLLQPLDLIH